MAATLGTHLWRKNKKKIISKLANVGKSLFVQPIRKLGDMVQKKIMTAEKAFENNNFKS